MHAVSGLQDARVRGVRQLPRAAETAVRGAQLRAARAGHGLHLLHLQPGRLVRLHTHVPHRQVQMQTVIILSSSGVICFVSGRQYPLL